MVGVSPPTSAPGCWPTSPTAPVSPTATPRRWPGGGSGAAGTTRGGSSSTWRCCWPTAGRLSATSPCCASSTRCSARWPPLRPPGGCWTRSTRLRWAGCGRPWLPPGSGPGWLAPSSGASFRPARRWPGSCARATAGSNTAADHVVVTDDLALAQLPDTHRHGSPILVRADGAGCSRGWLTHLRGLRADQGMDLRFSVGFTMTATVQQAILALPPAAWTPAVEADGSVRDGADVAELTGLLPDPAGAGWPRDARHRASGAAPPGRPADLLRRRRLALPGLRHRHRDRAARPAGGAPPRARPGRGPHPLREGHRSLALNAVWLRPLSCATGCCAWRRGSPAASAVSISGWPRTGRGRSTPSPPSPRCADCPERCPAGDLAVADRLDPRTPENRPPRRGFAVPAPRRASQFGLEHPSAP